MFSAEDESLTKYIVVNTLQTAKVMYYIGSKSFSTHVPEKKMISRMSGSSNKHVACVNSYFLCLSTLPLHVKTLIYR